LDRVAGELANVVQASVNIVMATMTLPARSQAAVAAAGSTVGVLLESREPEGHANVHIDSVRGVEPS
jgi:hypothetical protein